MQTAFFNIFHSVFVAWMMRQFQRDLTMLESRSSLLVSVVLGTHLSDGSVLTQMVFYTSQPHYQAYFMLLLTLF